MRKKLLLITALCILVMCFFAISVNAECTEHTYKWTVQTTNQGFLGAMQAKGECSCGATVNEKIPAPFIALGYSSSNDGVVQSYAVNREALKSYEQKTGENVKFGAVLATRNAIGDANPLNSKGEGVNEKVKVFDFTETKYDIIDVAVRGIPESYKNNAEMIFSLYVNAGGSISYLDNCVQKNDCGKRTYETVVEGPKAEAPSVDEETFIDKVKYKELDLSFAKAKFWNNSSLQDSANNPTFNNRYWGTVDKFNKESLPVGSLIYIDSANGWQYRPHKWGTTPRPSNTKNEWVSVDDAWWGNYTNVGFNISLYTKSTSPSDSNDLYEDISGYTEEQIAEIFKIFVPVKAEVAPEEPDTPVNPEPNPDPDPTPTPDPEEPTPEGPDYSDQKQNWNDDKALKILTIGNSFSDDSMEYVYQVAKSAGIETVVLGNLFIGGCSLDTHYSNALNDKTAYTYRTNTNGAWESVNSVSIKKAVESEDWDFISMQQVSGYSGVESSYANLNNLVDIVEPLNPSARLVWNMTWAYQKGSGHADFGKYNKDQMTMYNAIISTVQSKIVANDKFDIVIPAGTSIQNVRTSYIGDTLTRDGYHLSYDLGRFIASLTFVKALTGVSIDNVTYRPEGVDEAELIVSIECVNNAYKTPFAVTKSAYENAPEPEVNEELVELPLEYLGLVKSAYYNSSGSGKTLQTHDNSSASNLDNFFATKMFTKDTLPVGSVIYVTGEWQYRPERWPGDRPGNTSAEETVVDASWWDNETERAFNISLISGAKILAYSLEDVSNIFKIYVPKSALELNKPETPDIPVEPDTPETPDDDKVYIKSSNCVEEIVTINGKQYRALTVDALGLIKRAYYFSQSMGPTIYSTTDGTSKAYFATGIFTKDNLPDGAMIWVDSGWQYRPEGWIDETTKNSSSTRPGNISTTYVAIDEAWWGNWTIRGFNISQKGDSDITDLTNEEIYSHFKIYIPVENIQE